MSDYKTQTALESGELENSLDHSAAFSRNNIATSDSQEFSLAASLASVIEIPFVHKWTLITCMLLSLFVGWLAIMVWPRSYKSEAKLLFRVGRENVSIDPTATTSQTLLLQKTQEEDINSALEVLSSRKVSELVTEQLGAEAVLSGELPSAGNQSSSLYDQGKQFVRSIVSLVGQASGLKDKVSDQELAVMQLGETVEFEAPKKSTVITVRAYSKTPEMAQAIAQSTVDTFLKQHALVNQTQGSNSFYVKQAEAEDARLQELIEKKKIFMQKNKIVSIPAAKNLLEQQLSTINQEFSAASSELEKLIGETEALNIDQKTMDETVVSGKQESADSTWSALRTRVFELELQEKNESSLYTNDNPKLVRTREQLESARTTLDNFERLREDKSTTRNPLRQAVEEELHLQTAKLNGLRVLIPEKLKQKTELEKQIIDLLGWDSQLQILDREISVLTESLQTLRQKQEQTRVIDELQREGISNVSVFQPASLVSRAASPNKKLLAAAFVLTGLVSGFGLAFLKESGSKAMRTTDDVLHTLRTRVLGRIPQKTTTYVKNSIRTDGIEPELNSQCRTIISELLSHNQRTTGGISLGVIGVETGCGASTLATALAITSSHDFKLETTLVDTDLRLRTISQAFNLNGGPGLAELVQGVAELPDCIQTANGLDLQLVACSSVYGRPKPLDSSGKTVAAAVAQFQRHADLVIVDLPAAKSPDQLVAVAQKLDFVLLVIEAQKTERKEAAWIVQRLSRGNATLLGVVINKSQSYLPRFLSNLLNANS